ncbi:MAG TPA: hypothetical protein PLO67_05570 [Saprospiraceae bacterium]|nr:hypothetical protein [Saprospiraceae bacterium]HPI07376.1 hypothetical protein [Saprospiraceae bacterium]
MKNNRRVFYIVIIAAAAIYILLGMPGMIRMETFVGENGSGYSTGIQIPKFWLIAGPGVLLAFLIYRFQRNDKPTT